jgi:hypothetical protein
MMPVVFDYGACGKEEEWEEQLAKLKHYKEGHGDCNVPKRWAEEPKLGLWVSRQRKFKKALDRGEPSHGITTARAAKLDALGFEWQAPAHGGSLNDAGWEAQLAKLKVYKRRHGDCSVPNRWAEDPPLGRWVNTQRKCKRKLDHGEPSEGMTAARAAKLEVLGFAWELSAVARRRWGWADEAGVTDLEGGPTGLETLRYRQTRPQQCLSISTPWNFLTWLSRCLIRGLYCRSAVFASAETERAMRRVGPHNILGRK